MKKIRQTGLALAVMALVFSCEQKPKQEPIKQEEKLMMKVEKVAQIGEEEVFKYSLDNGNMQVEMTNYGGLISRIVVPDKNGNMENIALALDSIPDYFTRNTSFFGATAGRVANRISNASFELDGVTYELAKTNGKNHLHGGVDGFNKKVWKGEPYSNDSTLGVKMTYLSVDGEEGYPGNLTSTLWMELTRDNVIRIKFESTTDQKTIVNLTNHTYFNLSGIKRDVLDHEVQFWADAYTPVDGELIPTGEVKDVTGTPFDFRTPRVLGDQIAGNEGGFDHNMVTKNEKSPEFIQIARVKHPATGRTLEMMSDAPGVQFYTGNFLKDFAGAEGKTYQQYWGFCLESQVWPDGINKPHFPSPILEPGQKYTHHIEYKFGVEK